MRLLRFIVTNNTNIDRDETAITEYYVRLIWLCRSDIWKSINFSAMLTYDRDIIGLIPDVLASDSAFESGALELGG